MKTHSITTLCLVLIAALAGCASPHQTPDSTAPPAPVDVQPVVDPNTAKPSAPVQVDLTFDGNLGAGFYACTPAHCHGQDGVAGHPENIVTPPAGRLRSISLTMTWTAQTPATSTLDLGIMIMDHCPGCNVTMLGTAEGSSPLTITATDLDYAVSDANWFHYWGGNPTLSQWTPVAGAYATPDQAFS